MDYALGNGGEIFFALQVPFFLLFATGLVVLSWWVLRVTMWPIRKSKRVLARTKSETWTYHPSIDPHIRINPRISLQSCVPRQLVNPLRELRDSPPLPRPTRRRAHSSAITFS